jgi:hypothetical protein
VREGRLGGLAETVERAARRAFGVEAGGRPAAPRGVVAAVRAGRTRMRRGRAARAERGHHARRARRRGTHAGLGQRLADRADDQAAHQPRITEAHVGLGGMDVDVDQPRIERQEQRRDRVAVARQDVGIGGADRRGDLAVAHGPAVDIGELHQRVGAGEGGDRHLAAEVHALAQGVERQRVLRELLAQNLRQTAQPAVLVVGLGGQVEPRAVRAREREADGGKGDRDALDDVGDGGGFRALALHELQPDGRGVEEVAHLDLRAAIGGGRPQRRDPAALHRDLHRLVGLRRARTEGEPRDGADRGQGLATEAERADVVDVVRQLGGAVARDRERQFARRDAGAVVDDADQVQPAARGRDLDAGGAGVERVLDEFLHDARRPFDDLARGDLVDHGL